MSTFEPGSAEWIAEQKRERERRANGVADNVTPFPHTGSYAPKQPSTFETTCAFDLAGKAVPERKWLVEGVMPHENVTLLSGDGGLGKTILALMLGVAMSTKTEWLGFPTMGGRFLYVGAEDDSEEIHRRLDQMRLELGLSWESFADFHFRSLVGEDAIMACFDKAKNKMRPEPILESLEQRVADLQADAIVLDTSADMFGGDEINRAQVRQFISLLRGLCLRKHVSVILLSHPSVSGMTSGSGYSGSTGWNNSVRARVYLDADSEDPDARVLKFMKSNYGPKGKPLALRYQGGLFVRDAVRATRTPAEADAIFLTTLDRYTAQGRYVSPSPSSSYAPKVFADDKTCGLGKMALKDAMDRLMERKEIKVEEHGAPSRRVRKLVRAEGSD